MRRFSLADLPLFWKLLAPSVALTLVLGAAGTFAVVRYLANEAQANLDNQLSRTAVGAEVAIAEGANYLIEISRVNSHVQGIHEALARRRIDRLNELLSGSASVRDRADVFAFTDPAGIGLVELRRVGDGVTVGSGTAWSSAPNVQQALRADVHDVGDETAGWFRDGDTPLLLVAAPILDDGPPLGAAILGTDVRNLVDHAARQVGGAVAVYGPDGDLMAASQDDVDDHAPRLRSGQIVRRNDGGGRDTATVFAPLELRGGQTGVVGVSLPRGGSVSAFSGVGARVTAVFVAGVLLVLLIGAAIARSVLRRVRELLQAHRRLAAGDLAARAPEAGSDEFGNLSSGFNEMAEQLEASYRELEHRVAERTAELQRLYDESVAAAQARSEFFAAISHELRTPLFVIAGHAELMAHPELQPEEEGWEEEFGQTIHQSALDLLTRVNEILDLAKLETKKLTLDLRRVSVDEIARSLVTEMDPLVRHAGLRASVDIPKQLPLVRADPVRLRDILRNLVANAIKYTPPGGSVTISAAARSKRLVEVSVADTGIGIPEEAHAYLFEPFYQVPGITPQNKQTSTGLGLALAQRLVVAHGGTMKLRSQVGAGSTFCFTLRAVSS